MIGIVLTFIGGILDIKEDVNVGSLRITRRNFVQKHLWSDGTYVTLLAIASLLLKSQ